MTLHRERINAIKMTRKFLLELLNPKLSPRVPRAVRERAHALLRHFPGDYYAEEAFQAVMDDEELIDYLARKNK